jgi:DNA modification methylase
MNNDNYTHEKEAPSPGQRGDHRKLPEAQVLVGDAATRLRELPAASIDTVVTSPPYFLLRNYGVDGQIGADTSVDQWVEDLTAVLNEVRRVLKPTGSVWLNLGDTYSRRDRHGAPPKSLVLAPERLMVALTDAGWSVRNKVVWSKPNPMPASVRDRLANTWEPMLLLTKRRHYYFDLDGIRVPARSKLNRPSVIGAETKYGSGRERPPWSGPLAGNNSGLSAMKARGQSSHPLGKNPGDVWSIPTASYRGAHFATFPEALVHRPLLATCPERVCRTCGVPWNRAPFVRSVGSLAVLGQLRKSCPCSDGRWQPGVVLDPFIGAGTVGVVAEKLHRRWVGIELNPSFARLAEERVALARGAAA